MTPDQWQRAKKLLLRGVGPSPEEQERAVNEVFPGEPEVQEDVLRLLQATTSVVTDEQTTSAGPDGPPGPGGPDGPAGPRGHGGLGEPDRDGPAPGTPLLLPGAMCGPYRVIKMIGVGGMSQVFLARDVRTELPGVRARQVALKCLAGRWLASPDARATLLMEFANWASLGTHPHIGTPYDALDVREPQMLVLVLEYLDGSPLSKLTSRGPLPWRFALTLASQIAEGVGHAHDGGVLHCDIKAANVIVTGRNQAKVLDFGLSRAARLPGEDGAKIGTLPYMPPDRIIDNTLNEQGDLYSLGVTLFEMLTGRRPFTAVGELELMAEIIEAEPPRASTLTPGIPTEVDDIVARAMAKDPRQRFQSARELIAALKGALFRRPLTWAEVGVRTIVGTAVVLGVLLFLGFVSSTAVDTGLGRTGGFRPDLQRSLLVWGAMSLTAPVAVLLSGLLPLTALVIVLRLLYSNVRPLRRRAESIVVAVAARLRRVAAPPTETLSQAILLAQIGGLGAFIWSFFPYIMAIASFVTPVAPGSLADLRPGNDPLHETYLVWKTMMLFALLASSYALLRCRKSNGEGLNAPVVGGLVMIPLGLFLFVLPFQVVYHSENEKVLYASELCYLVARNEQGQARLFCPLATSERVRTVSLDDARLVQTGVVESVFSEFDRLGKASDVSR